VGFALVLMLALTACGGPAQPAQPPPTPLPQATTSPPTVAPPPTSTPKPTPTPLSLADVGSEFRTFVNEAHQYAIQVPIDWEITPRGASHADRIEVTAPGSKEIRGPNVVPPLVFDVSALKPDAGYSSISDVEANQSIGDEILDKVDLEVNGLPARRIHSRDVVFGDSRHYIIQRDSQFFIVDVYGYDQAPIEPILNTFGPPPELTTETVTGQIQELDLRARTMILATDTGPNRKVVWFTDTEILPQGRLEEHIDAGDRITAEGVVTDGGEMQATRLTLLAPEHAGSQPVLEFQRLGGIAGFQDRLVIFDDGTVRLQRGSEEPVEKVLPEDQWQKVKNDVTIFKSFAWHNEDNPGGPDSLVTDLDFYGTGKFEAAFDNQEEIVGYLQEILTQLSK
jgi:hypothetical protein